MRLPTQRVPKSDQTAKRPNTVNLSDRDLHKVLDAVDAAATPGHQRNREFIRWPFRRSSVRIDFHSLGDSGQHTSLSVACRNLSRGGASVLHSSYIHVGVGCTLHLPVDELTGATLHVSARVARCVHVSGTMHEVGIAFDDTIDVRQFIERDPFEDSFSIERVDEASLAGTVVYIDDSAMDHKLVRHFLRGTQVRLRPANSIEEGHSLINEGCDLVLTAYRIGDDTGLNLANTVRAQGVHVPVILATDESGPDLRRAIQASPVAAVLSKPLDQSRVLRALAEYLREAQSAGVVRSTLPADHPNFPLVETFAEDLKQQTTRLREYVQSDDTAGARSVCLQVSVSAPPVGFEGLGAMAKEAATALVRGTVADAKPKLDALLGACGKVQG